MVIAPITLANFALDVTTYLDYLASASVLEYLALVVEEGYAHSVAAAFVDLAPDTKRALVAAHQRHNGRASLLIHLAAGVNRPARLVARLVGFVN